MLVRDIQGSHYFQMRGRTDLYFRQLHIEVNSNMLIHVSSEQELYRGCNGRHVHLKCIRLIRLGSSPSWVIPKTKKIGIYCFSTKHAALMSESKVWLALYQDNVSEWSDVSTHRLLFQSASSIKNPIKHVSSTLLDVACSHHDIAEKFLILY